MTVSKCPHPDHIELILLRVHSSSELLQGMHVEVMILSPEPSSARWDQARCESKDSSNRFWVGI